MVNENTLSLASELEEIANGGYWFLREWHKDTVYNASQAIQSLYNEVAKLDNELHKVLRDNGKLAKERDYVYTQLNETKNKLAEIEFRMRKEERLENELKVCKQSLQDKENDYQQLMCSLNITSSTLEVERMNHRKTRQDADEEYANHSQTLTVSQKNAQEALNENCSLHHQLELAQAELESAKQGWVGEASKQEEGHKELENVSGMLVTLQAKHEEMLGELDKLMEKYRP